MDKFALKTGIKDWLVGCMGGNIEKVNPLDVFKVYKPMDRGNTKLCNSILSFSLLPVVTCGCMCEGCYDLKALRHTRCRKKRYVNTSMAMHQPELLEELIFKQVTTSKFCKYVRVHVGGEFYNQAYVDFWKRLAVRIKKARPEIKIYTYTKHLSYIKELNEAGINVVRSIYDNWVNFGSIEYVTEMAKKHKGIVCPATLGKVDSKFCGDKCKACISMANVFFLKH